jgi:hypothetical protein
VVCHERSDAVIAQNGWSSQFVTSRDRRIVTFYNIIYEKLHREKVLWRQKYFFTG